MTKTALKAKIMAELVKNFVEYDENGISFIARQKAWYNGHTDSMEYPNEVDDLKSFISSSLDTAIETAFRETEVNSAILVDKDIKTGFDYALAEKSAKEAEFINS